jgi:hypothetical protein
VGQAGKPGVPEKPGRSRGTFFRKRQAGIRNRDDAPTTGRKTKRILRQPDSCLRIPGQEAGFFSTAIPERGAAHPMIADPAIPVTHNTSSSPFCWKYLTMNEKKFAVISAVP